MAAKAWGNEYRTTMVCINSYENRNLTGRFYNPRIPEGIAFQSATEFLLGMEQTLDAMDFPQSFCAIRSFASPLEFTPDLSPPEFPPGSKATFAIKILFRQNTSWQGSVTWLEGGREQSFRSVLELLLLMDSVLNQEKAS